MLLSTVVLNSVTLQFILFFCHFCSWCHTWETIAWLKIIDIYSCFLLEFFKFHSWTMHVSGCEFFVLFCFLHADKLGYKCIVLHVDIWLSNTICWKTLFTCLEFSWYLCQKQLITSTGYISWLLIYFMVYLSLICQLCLGYSSFVVSIGKYESSNFVLFL